MRSLQVIKNIALAGVLAAGLALAQSPTPIPTKIGVINLQQAVPATAEGQAAVAKLQKDFVEPRTKALEAMQTEIRDLNDKLSRGGNTLSQTAKDDLNAEIQRKTKVFNRAVEDYEADSDDQQRRLLGDLSAKFQAVMNKFAGDNGYALVVDAANQNSNLVWSSSAIDITKAVVDAYDKANPAATTPAAAKPVVGVKPPATTVKPAAPPAPAKEP
jgi:outer membrane protein